MLIKRFFQEQRIPLLTSKAHAITIRCHDCKTKAPATLYPDGEKLPPGWIGVWVWFRRAYSCPVCGEKRRLWVRENILNNQK